jgi:branched-chain amino acid transport system permease protein
LPRRSIISLAVAAVLFPFVLSWLSDFTPLPTSALFTAVNLALIASVGAAAFTLLVGYAGQLSMAHAALLMVGTTAAGWIVSSLHWNFFVLLPVVGVVGAGVGALVSLPALRLRGMYLLLATLGFHYIASTLYQWFVPKQFGFVGIIFPAPTLGADFTLDSDQTWYWVLLLFATASILLMWRFVTTFEGRALAAIEARDSAAALLGINVARSKLVVFAFSSAFVAMSGMVSGFFLGARVESSFPVSVVLDYAVMIVVGGFSSLLGAVFGAFFFYIVPLVIDLLLQSLSSVALLAGLHDHNSEISTALFGLLIVVILVRRPDGLAGLWRAGRARLATKAQ